MREAPFFIRGFTGCVFGRHGPIGRETFQL